MVRKHISSQRLENERHITDFILGSELETSTGCYFGIGLSNKNGLTENLPFDSIGLILTAELVRERAELDKAIILIADEHAATVTNNIDLVNRIAKDRRDFVHRLLNRMDFYDFDIVLGSEIPRPEVQEFNGNRYEKLQIGDIEFFRQIGHRIKVGWEHGTMDFDERHFDNMYVKIFGQVMSFVYTEPGRALDGSAMPPYLCTEKPRLLFREGEDIGYKVDQMSKGTRAYFIRLMDLYNKLVCGHSGNGRNCPDKLKRRLKEVYSIVYGKAWY